MEKEYEKRGYLKESFHLFHLTDSTMQEFDYHYHDFNKIIFLISGNVTYFIEGKSYLLEPEDIILVNRHEIHKPQVDFSVPYERYILYIPFLEEDILGTCFGRKEREVLRLPADRTGGILASFQRLEASVNSKGFAQQEYSDSLYRQLLIEINREFLREDAVCTEPVIYDRKLFDILEYINQNLTKELTVDMLSERFFISKYHLMRTFKKKTGYSIHNYLIIKRLFLVRDRLSKEGDSRPISEISYSCGFHDYSSFFRAFRKQFQVTPEKYRDGCLK